MKEFITGIQQVGIGVTDAEEAKHLYKDLFGMDVLIFEDKAAASLMTDYTGNEIHHRHAILSLNISGGGGFEIWQYTSRKAKYPFNAAKLGDIGIYAVKIKSENVAAAHKYFSINQSVKISALMAAPIGRPHFWLTDSYGNQFNIVETTEHFKTGKSICGGVVGAVIGVSDMDKAVAFYTKVLGINEVEYINEAAVHDVPAGEAQGGVFKRALIKKRVGSHGAFSKLLGSVQIELVEAIERKPEKIYANRYWGDCGFIHLCFDVLDMDGLKCRSEKEGYSFSIDSAHSFSMGSSAGRFCYVEDPDGTLIELVETHKVPIFKKMGWYLDIKKRKAGKPLPDWMIGMMALSKIK